MRTGKGNQTHTSSHTQIPRPTGPPINPPLIEIFPGKKPPRGGRIDERQIPIQDPAPTARYRARGLDTRHVVEEGGPFFADEGRGAGQCRGRVEGQHVDALDVFDEAAEIGDVVGFVFEKLGMK